MKTRLAILLGLLCAALSGCSSVPTYEAKEVHRVMSYPLIFTDEVHAIGISKETAEDGKVKRKAETLTHGLTIGGFSRTVTYKDAVLETKK